MAEISGGMITYFGKENDVKAYVSRRAGETFKPALVIAHEIWGLNGHVKDLADQFARQGFTVIAPDLYSSSAFDGILTGQEIQCLLDFSSSLVRDRLAVPSYLSNEISKLPGEKRGMIRRIIRIFSGGIPKYKLLCELSKAAAHLGSWKYAAAGKIRLINVTPAGSYPALISFEDLELFYNIRYEEKNAQVDYLNARNPITPELLGLVRKGGERLYCTIPFKNLDLNADGINCCCWILDLEEFNNVSLEEGNDLAKAWKSEAFQRVRESIRDGSYKHCRLDCCPLARGERTNLLTLNEMRNSHPEIADFIEGKDLEYSGMPSFVHIAVDTTCNLKCPSCNWFLLPKIPGGIRSGIINSLKTVNKDLEIIYLAGMGEPFFSPVYLDWMMNFRKEDFPALKKIEINTNGLKLTPALWEKLPADLKSLINTFTVSIDGATAATYEKNRPGGSFKTLLENLAFFKELRDGGNIGYLRAYFAYQENNYGEMPEMIELARSFSFDLVFFERLRNWGTYKPASYRRRDIGNPEHPGYKSFQTVKDMINKMTGQGPRVIFTI